MLLNAGSLVATTAVTGIFGFAYWWVAARLFSPADVGLSAAAISAMTLLGTFCILGLGTLLIGELPRQPGKELSLISAALILVGGVGVCGGIVFALVAPCVAADFRAFGANLGVILLFAVGVGLTATTTVLDQALIGLLRGVIQFWRNTLFAGAKLVLLALAGFWLFTVGAKIIYGVWAASSLLSLLPLVGFVVLGRDRWGRALKPDWRLLGKLRLLALHHHILNLILQAPISAMPVLVTILLSATANAWFYVAWMISGLVFVASYALTTVLYAINSAQSSELMRKLRLTLSLAFAMSVLGNFLLLFAATQILDLFGHVYAQQAAWSLRILGLAAFPIIIKYHYIAVSRIHNKMVGAFVPVAIGSLLELGIAALGGHFGGLVGLCLGWVIAVCVEAVLMFPAVCRATFPARMTFILPIKQRLQVNSLHCRQCDAISPAHAHFCGSCGQKLGVVKLEELDTQKLGVVKLDKNVGVRSIVALLNDIAGVVLPLAAVVLWSLSLRTVDVGRMNDLGLVSVLPASIIIALIVLTLSFCLALNRQKRRIPIILFHLLILIFMLYGITTLVEQAPRFATVYRHAGYTDFIMRTGSVDPNLDAYFNWPGFFVLSAFLTRIAGYHDILPYAVWAPVYFNVIYLAPMYVIFTTATTDKRIIWLALWFFCVTNWIAQDYFSPQGLNFFLYLVIIAILLKWFRNPPSTHRRERRWQNLGRLSPLASRVVAWLTAPDSFLTPLQPRQRRVLLASVVIIFGLSVFSHPLTPFFVIASVGSLVIFGRCTPRWLPMIMIAITAAWLIFMAQTYFVGNLTQLLSNLGQVTDSVSMNVTGHVAQGSPGHTLIGEIRLGMTLCVWALAFVGAVCRLRRGFRDASFVLLAIVPFPLLFVQDYGGEMLLRIYLFTLPPMAFFAASLFYSAPARSASLWKKRGYGLAFYAQEERSASSRNKALWMQVTSAAVCIFLLGGFLFTRYGNERQDYMTNAEIAGIRHLYAIAPRNSLLMAAFEGTPWEFENYEQYDQEVLYDDVPDAVDNVNIGPLVQFIGRVHATKDYVVVTRSQRATAELAGYPPGMLDRFESELLASGKFTLIYRNNDTQIYVFTPGKRLHKNTM